VSGATPIVVARGRYGLSWRPADEGRMLRTSHALAADDRLWLVDPVDCDGLDGLIASLGDPAGIVLTVDRHARDAVAIAARLGVPVLADRALGRAERATERFSDRVPGSPLHSIPIPGRGLRRWWREAAVWWPEARVLVVGETLGDAPYFLLDDERLGLHPFRRSQPPMELLPCAPETILVGHGDGIPVGAEAPLRDTLQHGPGRRRPFWTVRTLLRARR
jgi:hypothetical protein